MRQEAARPILLQPAQGKRNQKGEERELDRDQEGDRQSDGQQHNNQQEETRRRGHQVQGITGDKLPARNLQAGLASAVRRTSASMKDR